MSVGVMALLAELGLFVIEQFGGLGAVGAVALQAVFFNRRVLPDVGTALVSMALVAELVHVFGLDHAVAQGTVGVVAI